MNTIRIASRSSKLALAQSHMIRRALIALQPGLEVTLVEISTTGDRDRSDFLYKSQVPGLFTSEVENALLEERADVAVHSLKDLPTTGPEALTVAAMPERESPADVLVAGSGITGLADLPAGATIGTSSLRRIAQICHHRPDLQAVPLRGNVETRIRKVKDGDVQAAVMAAAGINRLGLSSNISATLPVDSFLPAPAQGVLAVQVRATDQEVANLVSQLDHEPSRIAASAERQVLAAMQGGCSIPLGVYAHIEDDLLPLDAVIADTHGEGYFSSKRQGAPSQAEAMANDLAQALLNAGGQDILDHIRRSKDV
jgi:hydroxymethylbilane synthase